MAFPTEAQREEWQREFVREDELCDCVFPCPPKLRVSWTARNPARRFVNCARSMRGYICEYWRPVDPKLNSYYKQVLMELRFNTQNGHLHRQIETLQERLERMTEMMQRVEEEKSAIEIREEEVQSALQVKEVEVESALRSKEEELQNLLLANQAQYELKIKKLQGKVKNQRIFIWFMVIVGFGIWMQSA